MKKIKKRLSACLLSAFDRMAKNSVSYACLWVLHQPDEPESLQDK